MHGIIGSFWTAEKRETVRLLWGEGVSSGEIARELGCSRSAVMGLVTRKGWISPNNRGRNVSPEKSDLIRQMHSEGWADAKIALELDCRRQTIGRHLALLGRERRTTPAERPPKPNFATIRRAAAPVCEPDPIKRSEASRKAFGEPCGILDLATDCCRWPVTDASPHLFCNAKTPQGLPYCDAHMRISYQPGKKRAA